MIPTIPAKFHGRARRDAAAFYLSQLARGILAGEIRVGIGERQTTLAPSEFVILEIDVKQTRRGHSVEITLHSAEGGDVRAGRVRSGESRDGEGSAVRAGDDRSGPPHEIV
jgi:amphi-Trp domain-containing protein